MYSDIKYRQLAIPNASVSAGARAAAYPVDSLFSEVVQSNSSK